MKQLLFGSSFTGNKAFHIAWLLLRFYIGFTIAIGAGWPKLNAIAAPGWFVKQVGDLGFTFPSPAFWAAAASWGEFVGGLCIAVGLLTRFSAFQLVIQFFVVAFLWYDELAPFTGMYYQQLLFWGFVVIAVGGSGKFGLDNWIMNRKQKINLQPLSASMAVIALLVVSSSFAQPKAPSLQTKDLLLLRGTWKGTLTYKDYTSGTKETIPVVIYGWCKDKEESTCRTWALKFEYPGEPNANKEEAYTLAKDGRSFNGATIIEKKKLADGTLRFVTEEKGTDGNDNKTCIIRHVYQLRYGLFSITKRVKFEGESTFFERNEYKVTR